MRLVRELLAADAEPEVASADAVGRARRLLSVVSAGLGLRGAAVFLKTGPAGDLACVASELPRGAGAILGQGSVTQGTRLVRRAFEGRRAFLVRKTSDEPLLAALREADDAIDTLAVVPLADRAPVGVLVLAANDLLLSAEVVKSLNPALRLLGILLSPARDGLGGSAGGSELRDALESERDRGSRLAQEVAWLRTRLDELAARSSAAPPPTVARVEAAVAATAQEAHALVDALGAGGSATPAPSPPVVLVVDAGSTWEDIAVAGHEIVLAAPEGELVQWAQAASPARIVVNLVVPGALEGLATLRRAGVVAPAWGYLRAVDADRVLGLGFVEAVGHPPTPEAMAAAVEREAPRGGRVFAAGRDAEALMRMRQALSREGLSVSMARDAKQANELIAMVKPQVIVLDLALPRREGYDLVMRTGGADPPPGLVLVLAEAEPAAIFGEKLREPGALERGMQAKQWLTALLARKLPARASQPRPSPAPVPSH